MESGVKVAASLLLCGAMTPAYSERLFLHHVVDTQHIERGYGLGVVEVPDPPAGANPSQPVAVARCPIEVRAIVVGDSSRFAMLAWKRKSGEIESTLVEPGEGVRAPTGWLVVSSIARDHVLLRRGSESFTCALEGGQHSSTR